MEKDMATHSSILAWKIPRAEEAGGLARVQGTAKGWTRLSDFTCSLKVDLNSFKSDIYQKKNPGGNLTVASFS